MPQEGVTYSANDHPTVLGICLQPLWWVAHSPVPQVPGVFEGVAAIKERPVNLPKPHPHPPYKIRVLLVERFDVPQQIQVSCWNLFVPALGVIHSDLPRWTIKYLKIWEHTTCCDNSQVRYFHSAYDTNGWKYVSFSFEKLVFLNYTHPQDEMVPLLRSLSAHNPRKEDLCARMEILFGYWLRTRIIIIFFLIWYKTINRIYNKDNDIMKYNET